MSSIVLLLHTFTENAFFSGKQSDGLSNNSRLGNAKPLREELEQSFVFFIVTNTCRCFHT
jgi:hypothetical protein